MATVSVNPPKTPVTKGSSGIAAATVPNVCKMPGPPAPFVPTPLPNIGKSGDSPKGYSKKVKVEGQPVAIKGATFKSMGDIASKGTGGGIVSSNTHGPTKFIGPGSFNVKIEGKNVQYLGDPMLNNCGSPPNSSATAEVQSSSAPSPAFENKQKTLANIKKADQRSTSTVGDGTTAAALLQETATSQQVKGKWHYIKAKELCTRYKNLDDDAVKEGKSGDITKEECDSLTNETTVGYVRNHDAVRVADQMPNPPWPRI